MGFSPYKARHNINSSIREFFGHRDFIEVETPILVQCPGMEVHLDYFQSEWSDYQEKTHELFLRSSPELHMKEVLCQGEERIYQIAKSFRNNGELTPWHSPEFSLLEWYQVGVSFDDFINQTHDLIQHCRKGLKKLGVNSPIDSPPKKITVKEAFLEFLRIELIDDDPDFAEKCRDAGVYSVQKQDDFETAFFKTMLDAIEPEFKKMKYVVLCDYPASQAALSQVQNGVAKRFEFYLQGVELCNAFLELSDYKGNVARASEITRRREIEGKKSSGKAETFLESIRSGIPPSCGNALGVDRLLALLHDQGNILKSLPFRDPIFRSH